MSARAKAAALAGGPAVQVGALCLRADGCVLLITTRGTRRWIIPKGWEIDGLGPAGSALQEAWEEAGVEGSVVENPVGSYRYDKTLKDGRILAIEVRVYRVIVTALAETFPEAGQRKRRWFRPVKAAGRVAEPELRQLLAALPDPGPEAAD